MDTPPHPGRSTTLRKLVGSYLAGREDEAGDELLIMPSSWEVRTAAQLLAKLGGENVPSVPNSVPVYLVDGLEGEEGSTCFLRFGDMQKRLEGVRNASMAAGDESPKLKVRILRLHEVAAFVGSTRLPGTARGVEAARTLAYLQSRSGPQAPSALCPHPRLFRM